MSKTIVITGPTSGTGRYLAKQLAPDNRLILIGRHFGRLEELKSELHNVALSVTLIQCDLADFTQVSESARLLSAPGNHVDVFICNAGILGNETARENEAGFEETFMINYLSHYLLLSAALPSILECNGTIFNLCSQSHKWYSLDFNDLQSKKNYKPMKAYSRSKRMLLLLGMWLGSEGIDTYNIDPGTFRSGIARSRGRWFQFLYALGKPGMRSPEQAAADIMAIIKGTLSAPSGVLVKNGKVKEIQYGDEEIGKLISQTSLISGVNIVDRMRKIKFTGS